MSQRPNARRFAVVRRPLSPVRLQLHPWAAGALGLGLLVLLGWSAATTTYALFRDEFLTQIVTRHSAAERTSRAEIARLKDRMGWDIPWYTITDEFDADFDVAEWHGTNAFLRDGGEIFRTYFVDARGDEAMGGTWAYLDITALGRQEEWEDSPEGYPQTPPYSWWNYHDNYEAVGAK